MKIRVLTVAATIVIGACGGEPPPVSTGGPPSTRTATHNEANKNDGSGPYAAPDFTVTTFEGEEFRLAVHKGTPVVLNFWESW